MKRLLFLLPLALAACDANAPNTVSTTPVVGAVCKQVSIQRLDVALNSYDVAMDTVNVLIDRKVIVPGSATAVAIANANDRILAAFKVAEAARVACNANSYTAALLDIQQGIIDLKIAIHGERNEPQISR